ncbi:GlpM family protein [Hoeflea sp. G2-23]|uniref:GlpM family protein n=1 Tax=Hoeflea algicola TaxID=2983763 RepID=A0ABT3ZBV0_9HYPH|nr:GlpM family protein [Hoeflea algicola]MCY0149276.1 GlpM family protein [Hoeflea algicola]
MDVVWKGIVGGLATALIVALSKRGNVLPGILPLFPTFGLIALLIIGAKGDMVAFRETCLAGIKTIPAYVAFLMACYWTIARVDFVTAVCVGILVWLTVAVVIFLGAGLFGLSR